MEKVVLCGASGLVGRPLIKTLEPRYHLLMLRRKLPPTISADSAREVIWNPPYTGDWINRLDGVYGVINLSGEPIAGKRWTAKQKKELKESRLSATKAIIEAIRQAKVKPKVLINASAIGFYGDRGVSPLNESSASGRGFLPELCQEWEAAALKAESFGVRVVLLRTGVVLSKEGGALAKMVPPFKMFLGGPLGSGKQVMSWIHVEDEVGAIVRCLEDPALSGPVNLTAPNPVTMREFAQALGKKLKKPSFFPVPGFMLQWMLGEMSEMLLTGQNVQPKKLLGSGFTFRHPTLDSALNNLL